MNPPLYTPTFPAESSHPTTLKRIRSEDAIHRRFDASRLPSLPRISGDIALQVFTHISLRRPNVSPANYGDNERLSDLGRAMFGLAVTNFLFQQRPMLQASEISKMRELLLSSDIIRDWVSGYNLMPKLRCHPDLLSTLHLPQEVLNLFYAYVGGLYVLSSQQVVEDWIHGLLAPELEFLRLRTNPRPPNPVSQEFPSSKRVKTEPEEPIMPTSNQTFTSPEILAPHATQHSLKNELVELAKDTRRSTLTPPEPALNQAARYPSPHIHNPVSSPPNPLAPAQPNLPFLPLFNQAAVQRRVTVEYIAEFSGPSHAGRWAVKCVVNGICKGEGWGVSKQLAKEEAARKAYYSMGWT